MGIGQLSKTGLRVPDRTMRAKKNPPCPLLGRAGLVPGRRSNHAANAGAFPDEAIKLRTLLRIASPRGERSATMRCRVLGSMLNQLASSSGTPAAARTEGARGSWMSLAMVCIGFSYLNRACRPFETLKTKPQKDDTHDRKAINARQHRQPVLENPMRTTGAH